MGERIGWKGYLYALSALLFVASCGGGGGDSDAATDAADARTDGPMACTADTDCDDGLFCNGAETCSDGFCAAGTAPDCDDSDACTADRCDEDRGECVNETPDVDGDGHAPLDCGGDDCDDEDANRFPGNVEVCDADNHDEDCDATTFGAEDRDGDGFLDARCCNTDAAGGMNCGDDCDDVHATVHPTATETCDGFDNNCDGEVDEGVAVTVYPDTDFDGHGDDSAASVQRCADAVGFSVLNDDCDDTNPTIYTGQVEICDALDNDCDGVVDDSPVPVTWYADSDGDGFGSAASGSMESCTPIAGYTLTSQDCDDTDAAINPAAAELCDGKDNNCSGSPDFRIGVNDTEDDDGDGVVDIACGAPFGMDCDDADPLTGGGQPEICDGRDNNCNGEVDEGAMDRQWFRDADGDGYGSITSGTRVGCMAVPGFIGVGGDCNDADPARHPGAAESCNGVDDDCDGSVDGASADTECVVPNAAPACIGGRCQVARCADGFGDCDGDATNGCEVTLSDTADHCGSCDVACAPGHGSASCVSGACVFGACDAGYADCNMDTSDGCETATTDDVSNCGGCGTTCSYANASATCAASTCALGACDFGYENCDGDPSNGCEASPSSDPNNCGRCGNVCDGARLHTTAPACSFGRCAVDDAAPACEAGWADCDGNPFNGCETPTDRDPNNCGACGTSCDVPGGIASCSSGSCMFNRCEPGFDDCNMDATSFGAGDGCETPVDSDPANCGACGNSCGALPSATGGCFFGRCGIASCNTGFEDCDGIIANGCEASTGSDPNNCGMCGNRCDIPNASTGCSGASCVFNSCLSGFLDCDLSSGPGSDGCEIDSNNDVANCGACGNDCRAKANVTAATCGFGRCGIVTCAAGFDDCDGDPMNGCEADLNNDVNNCGGCGTDCMAAPDVTSATCAMVGGTPTCQITSCRAGRADCNGDPRDGCEADLNSDPNTCGSCMTSCSAALPHSTTTVCSSGTCLSAGCAAGWDDCDGDPSNDCEADTTSDPLNCAFCGNDCTLGGSLPGSTCMVPVGGGAPTCNLACPFGFDDCDGDPMNGCEADIRNDPNNCGGCDSPGAPTVCPGGPNSVPVCNTGSCGVACNPDFADCDGDPVNGCEINTGSDPMNCGGCGAGFKCTPGGVNMPQCNFGACGYDFCQTGFSDCDGDPTNGCETPSDSDPNNCGGCGISCGVAGVCTGGTCDGAIDVSVGATHSCAVRASGAVVCWGDNASGQLGDGTTVASNVPVDTGLRGMRSVSAGGQHTCAVSASTGDIYCWGDDALGQLGTTADTSFATPSMPVDRSLLAPGEGFIEVSAGMNHTCAVTNQNQVFCWGDDARGALGDGTIGSPASSATPTMVTGLSGTARPSLIACGDGFSCVFDASVGAVDCWGAGDVGQLGRGSTADSAVPGAVAGAADLSGTMQITAGPRHACARTSGGGGSLFCWGDNATDAITVGASSPQTVAFQIGVTFVDQVLTVADATCALSGGNLQCWGGNSGNRLGVSAVTDPQPNPAPLSPSYSPTALPAQGGLGTHQCALRGRGVECWGDNFNGELGLGFTGGTVTSPGAVVGLVP